MNDTEIMNSIFKGQTTAESRWARFGPYYAMFPMEFACEIISRYSERGDLVLDPFAGRGSSIFASAALKRNAFGIEINPVGWLYSNIKLHPAPLNEINNRLREILEVSPKYQKEARQYSEFFRVCFSENVLAFLLASKATLSWKTNNTDATLMSFILLYLHGKREYSLSNQMPMTKATSIDYSLEWWKNRNLLQPPDIDISLFFKKRFKWRYGKGVPVFNDACVVLGDSTELMPRYVNDNVSKVGVSLLFTSPPYFGVTNYFVDQWLRMWMLGGEPKPSILLAEKYKKRFNSKTEYEELLDCVFSQCAKIMKPESTVYVRTDVREFTLETTRKILKKYFSNHTYREEINSCKKLSQTELLNNSSAKPCEVDIILQKKRR